MSTASLAQVVLGWQNAKSSERGGQRRLEMRESKERRRIKEEEE